MRKKGSRGNVNAVYEIASSQGGYFTAQQAVKAGYSKRLQHYHRTHGNWLRVGHGIFRLKNFPPGQWEDLIRWSLWSRNQKGEIQATVSHESAALVYELADYLPMKVHLTVPRSFRKPILKGCVLHHATVEPKDSEVHSGYRVTTPFRTLCDLKEAEGEHERLRQAVNDAVRRGLITQVQKKTFQSI
jgi:predicted transcriptional regulator of viral defense system